MINILVVDDNYNYSKNLINIISQEIPKARIYNFCTDGTEAIDIINIHQEFIDIILLDLKLPNYDGMQILNYIEKNNLIKYKDSIIIISGETDLLLKISRNEYIHSFINKLSGFDKIKKEIKELIEIKDFEKNSIEYKVYKELKKLNFNFSYIGTQYLLEAITSLYDYNVNIKEPKIEKNIYPIIAKKHKKTVNNIKTNILHTCNLMYYDCEDKTLKQYFEDPYIKKPTPKATIITILNHLKYKY